MAVSPRLQEAYARNPAAMASAFGLSPTEAQAVTSGAPFGIRAALKQTPAAVAAQYVQAILGNPQLALQYQNVLKQNSGKADGDQALAAWLKSKGFDITPEAVVPPTRLWSTRSSAPGRHLQPTR